MPYTPDVDQDIETAIVNLSGVRKARDDRERLARIIIAQKKLREAAVLLEAA